MSAINNIVRRFRSVQSLEQAFGLRPPYPPVALELDQTTIRLVRIKRRRRGLPVLEAHREVALDKPELPASIFEPVATGNGSLLEKVRALFETTGTRPARVSLIFPDNLAKISLVQLPERPASPKQLDELVRAKMRRAVPFRLEEARLAYELLPGAQREVTVLVTVVRSALVERFEAVLETLGARAGLVDISTPNLLNLCRKRIEVAASGGHDVALLNCAGPYFSLVIVREGRVIFFRCKTFAITDENGRASDALLLREVGSSLAYYREKLDGESLRAVFVRSVDFDINELAARLSDLGCGEVGMISSRDAVDPGSDAVLDPFAGQRLLPALGAASGRG